MTLIYLFPNKFPLFLAPEITTFVTSVVSVTLMTLPLPLLSPLPSFTLVLIIVTIFTTDFLSCKFNAFNKLKMHLPALSHAIPKHFHFTPALKSLHWLKIEQRIHYKIISITHNLLHSSELQYLCKLIKVKPSGKTCSSEYFLLIQVLAHLSTQSESFASTSYIKTKILQLFLPHLCTHLWNSLPPLPQNLCTRQRRNHYKYNKYHQFISFTNL